MSVHTGSAPGKVVLSGEYAVLDGAPAIAMAVDRRAVVTLDGTVGAQVNSLGSGRDGDTRLLDCACAALHIERPRSAVTLDTRDFVDSATELKYGVGSSAALTVALVAALSPPDLDHAARAAAAHDAHREFQSGVGSGVDVATSIAGGLIAYRIDELESTPLAWPDGLHYALLWSGVPVSTRAKLEQFSASRESDERIRLVEASTAIANAWVTGDADALVQEYVAYVTALRRFDAQLGLGIFAAGHDGMAAEAEAAGLVYKSCGAGGGDIGILLGTDENRVREVADAAAAIGFKTLDFGIDFRGSEAGGS